MKQLQVGFLPHSLQNNIHYPTNAHTWRQNFSSPYKTIPFISFTHLTKKKHKHHYNSNKHHRHPSFEMGICSSCDSTSVTTAKLILQDGKLVEFSQSVRVSYVLQRNHGCFICNSDDMEFDEFVSALSPEEELQLGQLYFALPVSRLRYPLQAEDMAALAVRASSALGGGDKCGGAGCRKKGVVPITCSEREEFKSIARGVGSGGGVVAKRKKNGGKGRRFAAKLSSIEE